MNDNLLKYIIYDTIQSYCKYNYLNINKYSNGIIEETFAEGIQFTNELTQLYTKTVMNIRKQIKQKYKNSGFEVGDLVEEE